MSILQCNNCGYDVSSQAPVCPKCGQKFEPILDATIKNSNRSTTLKSRLESITAKQIKIVSGIVAGIVALCILLAMVFSSGRYAINKEYREGFTADTIRSANKFLNEYDSALRKAKKTGDLSIIADKAADLNGLSFEFIGPYSMNEIYAGPDTMEDLYYGILEMDSHILNVSHAFDAKEDLEDALYDIYSEFEEDFYMSFEDVDTDSVEEVQNYLIDLMIDEFEENTKEWCK